MSDETDVRPGVGGAVRYGYVILTTYHTYLDLSSITDTGYFGYYSITHTIVCVILAKKQYHISIHGYYNVHGTPGPPPQLYDHSYTAAAAIATAAVATI